MTAFAHSVSQRLSDAEGWVGEHLAERGITVSRGGDFNAGLSGIDSRGMSSSRRAA